MIPVSKQQVRVVVDGKTYTVEIEDIMSSPTTVTVNGKPYTVDVYETGTVSGMPAVSTAAPAPALPAVSPVFGVAEVQAPMPGTILDIRVKPGDKVTRGQELCFLEAMKMKNAIKAPADAVVASVEVTDGQAVNHGDVLFTFEEGSVVISTPTAAPSPAVTPKPAEDPLQAAPVLPQATAATAPAAPNQIRAPMPGTILDIQVKAGDKVSSGQELCYLEAMKMKNAIRANREAVIASVEVNEGDTVAHGEVLFTFE